MSLRWDGRDPYQAMLDQLFQTVYFVILVHDRMERLSQLAL